MDIGKIKIPAKANLCYKLFNQQIKLMAEFQEMPCVSKLFEFAENHASYDYPTLQKLDILKNDYGSPFNVLNDFTKLNRQFRDELEIQYGRNKQKEFKELLKPLQARAAQLAHATKEENVKAYVKAKFKEDDKYEALEDFVPGFQLRSIRTNVWAEFNLSMLEQEYLFMESYEWIERMYNAIHIIVEDFADTHRNAKKANPKKPLRKSIHSSIQEFIPTKWDEFLELCKYYSSYDTNLEHTVIRYNDEKGKYIWLGIGDAPIPSLGVFVRLLEERHFLHVPRGGAIKCAESFMRFFQLPDDKELAKYLRKSWRNEYRFVEHFKHITQGNGKPNSKAVGE